MKGAPKGNSLHLLNFHPSHSNDTLLTIIIDSNIPPCYDTHVYPELRKAFVAFHPIALPFARLLRDSLTRRCSCGASAPPVLSRLVFPSKLFRMRSSKNTPLTAVESAVSKHRT